VAEHKFFPEEPPDEFKRELRTVLAQPVERLKAARDWAEGRGASIVRLDPDELRDAAESRGIPADEFGRSVSILASLLVIGAQTTGKTEDLISDLIALGLGEESAHKVTHLVGGLSLSREESKTALRSRVVGDLAVPRVSDVDVVCDFRAQFRELASSSTTKKHDEQARIFEAFVPVLIMSLEYEDEAGNDHAVVVQFDEAGFRRYIRTLENALAQLEIAKTKIVNT